MDAKYSISVKRVAFVSVLLIAAFFVCSCKSGGSAGGSLEGGGGGGGGGNGGGPTPNILSWQPPANFDDGGALDPLKDLSLYEIYINETGNFLPTDAPRAVSLTVDTSSGVPITSFDLVKISPPLQLGKTYFVSMRAVDTNGGKSPLTPPALFIY